MSRQSLTFRSRTFFKEAGTQKTVHDYQDREVIYSQGDAADAIFQIQSGNVKLAIRSPRGKQAVIAILGPSDLFGEGCLGTKSLRVTTATAIQLSTIVSVKKGTLVRLIHQDPAFAKEFIFFLLARMIRVEEDFADRLFNFSEKRLARILLMLTTVGKDDQAQTSLPLFNQEQLAQMVGTTRSRVSHFMNKFRKLGFVDYHNSGALTVHSRLLKAVLHERDSVKRPVVPAGDPRSSTRLGFGEQIRPDA